jgi:hypothetical protein
VVLDKPRRIFSLQRFVCRRGLTSVYVHKQALEAGTSNYNPDPDVWQVCTPRLLQPMHSRLPSGFKAIAISRELLNAIGILENSCPECDT